MAIEPSTYRNWIERYDTLSEADLVRARRFLRTLKRRPRIDVVMPVHNTPEPFLTAALESVQNQIYPDWTLCIFDDGSTTPYVANTLEQAAQADPRIRVAHGSAQAGIAVATNGALALGDGEFVAFLDHDDILAPHALLLIAHSLERWPDAMLVNGDFDLLDEHGERMSPFFKPQYDHDLLLALNVVFWGAFRRSLIEEIGGMRSGYPGSEDFDLSLRAVERVPSATIHHVPHVLYHWRMVPSSSSHVRLRSAIDSAQRAVREHCERIGVPSSVGPAPRTLAWNRVRALQEPLPRTTLIVEGAAVGERERLSAQYAANTAGDAWVVDVGAASGPVGSRRNEAARLAATELIAFLDARLLPRNRDWLAEMANHFAHPACAAVGARIVGSDGSIEQCGVLLGVRQQPGSFPVTRVLHGAADDDCGYFGRSELCHRTSVVTGGVLLARRNAVLELGGFDESLGDSYAVDVDWCLRARERGLSLVTCPNATFQAARPSRWFDDAESVAALYRRWGARLEADPYYNPNLADVGAAFSLAFPPRVRFPWRS